MSEITRRYATSEISVIWKPSLCTKCHACVEGLPQVFKPDDRPWVKIDAATADEIASQVKACPSGALSLEVA